LLIAGAGFELMTFATGYKEETDELPGCSISLILNFRYKKTSIKLAFKLVAGAGFEPTTFGL
jgi:hypothetical protein